MISLSSFKFEFFVIECKDLLKREIERTTCCGFAFVFSRKSGATIIIYQIVFDLNVVFVGELNVEFTSFFKHSSCSVVCNFVAIFHLPVASNSEINLSSVTCFRNFEIIIVLICSVLAQLNGEMIAIRAYY